MYKVRLGFEVGALYQARAQRNVVVLKVLGVDIACRVMVVKSKSRNP